MSYTRYTLVFKIKRKHKKILILHDDDNNNNQSIVGSWLHQNT